MKHAMRLLSFANDMTSQLNLRQSFMNGLLTFVFRLVSLIMLPITLKITSSEEYVSMATSAIMFQLVSTIFIGSIQRKIYESRKFVGFHDLQQTLAANLIIFAFLAVITNYALSNVIWLNKNIINFGIIEAFFYSIFSGWLISAKLKFGDFGSIRLLQLLDFILIGPFRLLVLYLSHSVLIWAAVGVLIRIGQLTITWFYIADSRRNNDQFIPLGAIPKERGINFDYSFINITFWVLSNSAPLISLKFAPSSYIKALQVSIAVAGILGSLLTQVSNALIPLYLKNPQSSIRQKMKKQFVVLAFSCSILGTPIAFIAVSHILDTPIEHYFQLTLIYISINLLFGFISLFQVFSYGSDSRTRHLRNGCIASLLSTLILDICTYSNSAFKNLPSFSLVGYLILIAYLYVFQKLEMRSKS